MSGRNSGKKPVHRRLRYKRNVQKFVILPTSLLLLNIFEELFCYKADVIANPYLRTGALMLMFLCGFTLVGLVFSPMISASLERMYYGGRKSGGYLGELLVLLVLYAALYYVYYLLYGSSAGVENILPETWHNGEALF